MKLIGSMVEIGVSIDDISDIIHENCKLYHLVVSQIDSLDDEIKKLHSNNPIISDKSDTQSTQ